MATSSLTRRNLIAGGALLAAVALVPTVAHADTVATFALDPSGGPSCTGGCRACFACQAHAANKLFRTAVDADQGRAHPGCNCAVVPGQPLSQATLDSVFAQGGSVDRRHTQTAQLLAAEQEQHSVPMLPGAVPAIVVAGGGAAIWWVAARRRAVTEP